MPAVVFDTESTQEHYCFIHITKLFFHCVQAVSNIAIRDWSEPCQFKSEGFTIQFERVKKTMMAVFMASTDVHYWLISCFFIKNIPLI